MDLHTAIDAYHALLDPASARETFQRLDAAIRARNMLVGKNRDRLVCEVLRPRFLAPAQYRALQPATQLVGSAIQRIGAACLERPELLAPYALTPVERELLAIDPGYPGASRFGRLDGFLAADGSWCWFVESNLESPAGIAYEDALVEDFLQLPIMQAFMERFPVQVFSLWKRLHSELLTAWNSWGGSGQPAVAIVDFRTAVTMPEFEFLAARFSEAGTPTIIADPEDLRYDGKHLYALQGSKRTNIDLVYRRILQHEFLARYDLSHALVQASAAGHVCVINPWRTKPVHTKLIMALLSDEDGPAHALLNSAEQQAVRNHVPWTRLMHRGASRYQDEVIVDLPEFVANNRERFVLKPNDEYGGSGVMLGWEMTEDAWHNAIARAMQGPWVVQERVPLPQEQYPTWSETAGLQFTARYVDSDPCVFGVGEDVSAAGCLTRIAAVSLLNVSAGGGAAPPTFLLGS